MKLFNICWNKTWKKCFKLLFCIEWKFIITTLKFFNLNQKKILSNENVYTEHLKSENSFWDIFLAITVQIIVKTLLLLLL